MKGGRFTGCSVGHLRIDNVALPIEGVATNVHDAAGIRKIRKIHETSVEENPPGDEGGAGSIHAHNGGAH